MTRKNLLLACLAVALLAGCSGTTPPFTYAVHSPPRVSVLHSPLNPEPGDPIELRARAEGGVEVELNLIVPGRGHQQHTCAGSGTCDHTFTGARRAGGGLYWARVRTSSGDMVRSPGAYGFTVGEIRPPAPGAAPTRLHVLRSGSSASAALKVAFIRHGNSYPNTEFDGFLEDLEAVIEGLVTDPAWRWRDNQLAVYLLNRTGQTSDRASGEATRCGQRPFITGTLPAQLADFDAVGVIHDNAGWRDCAGLADSTGGPALFSGYGGEPAVVRHELGHALFGLGDEYTESTASRTAPGGDDDPVCNCCVPDPVTVIGGNSCLGQTVCPPGGPPASCAVPSVCPPLEGTCEAPNVFRSEAECTAAVTAINAHPGIEVTPSASDCRLLCSGNCPCPGAPPQLWILDEPPGGVATDGDLMRDSDRAANAHGAACRLCVERTLCERWETARGSDATTRSAVCHLP